MNTNKTFSKAFNKKYWMNFNNKYWMNFGEFCNRKNHPFTVLYRRYRKGKNRCVNCGAKIGRVNLERKSNRELLIDSLCSRPSLLNLFKQRNIIVE